MPFPTPEEFEHQRQVIRDAYPQLFEAAEGQLKYVADHIGEMQTPDEWTRYDLALKALLARATKTALGIVRECEHGFGELAMSSLRTLGETVVSAYYMSLEPAVRSEAFDEYAKLETLDTLNLLDELGWADQPGVEVSAELRDEAWQAQVRDRFRRPAQGWFQRPMREVVGEIEQCWQDEAGRREFRQYMRILHLYGDRHSHVGSFDTAQYLRAADGELTIRFGPTKRWVPQALVMAA